jgi:hypothetical protein
MEGAFVDRAENVLAFGNRGSGKTHLLCAIGQELIHRGRSVMFFSCSLLVQELLVAKPSFASRAFSNASDDSTRSSSTISATCSRTARRWRSSSLCLRNATSGPV